MIKKGQILNDINLNAAFMSKTDLTSNSIVGLITTPQTITGGALVSTGTATISGNTTISGILTLNSTTSGQIALGASGSGETDIHYTSSSGSWQAGINNTGNGTSNNQFFFYEGSVYRLTIQRGTGNVGINTAVPTDLLTVALATDGAATSRKAIRFNNGGWAAPIAPTSGTTTSDGDKLILYRASGETHSIGLEASNMWLQSKDSVKFYDSTAATKARITLISGDNYFLTGGLGVGTSTPGTWSGLTPGGTNLQVYASNTYSRAIINSATNDPEIHLVRGANAVDDKNYRFTVTANNLTLDQPNDAYTANQHLMTWTKDGNVGINTPTPYQKLDVDGVIRAKQGIEVNDEDVTADNTYGIYWNGQGASNYGIYRESGAWTTPFPDLRIAFSTGIKIGAYKGYGGTRFYNDSNFATEIMSVGNGDDHIRIANNLIVAGSVTWSGGSSTNANSAYTHISNNGSDHSYINQSVTTTSTPKFYGLQITHPTGPYTADIIKTYGSDANGLGAYMQTGGALIIGAGESASSVYTNLVATTEELWLTADSNLRFMSNVQSGYASRKEMSLGTDGVLNLPGALNIVSKFKIEYNSTENSLDFVYTG